MPGTMRMRRMVKSEFRRAPARRMMVMANVAGMAKTIARATDPVAMMTLLAKARRNSGSCKMAPKCSNVGAQI